MDRIEYITIHCSATPEGREVSNQDIEQWHKLRGFKEIGYHYVIHLDGTVEQGRSIHVQGAGVRGFNKNNMHICYVGGVDKDFLPKDTRTDAQKEALGQMLVTTRHSFPNAKILGHRDFPDVNKACPSFDAQEEYKNI